VKTKKQSTQLLKAAILKSFAKDASLEQFRQAQMILDAGPSAPEYDFKSAVEGKGTNIFARFMEALHGQSQEHDSFRGLHKGNRHHSMDEDETQAHEHEEEELGELEGQEHEEGHEDEEAVDIIEKLLGQEKGEEDLLEELERLIKEEEGEDEEEEHETGEVEHEIEGEDTHDEVHKMNPHSEQRKSIRMKRLSEVHKKRGEGKGESHEEHEHAGKEAHDAALKQIVLSLKPAIAKLDSRGQRLVKDALTKYVRTSDSGTNTYGKIKEAVASHSGKTTKDSKAAIDPTNVGKVIAKAYNPHYKKEQAVVLDFAKSN